MKNILTMKYFVICGGESGWRFRRPEDDESLLSHDTPLLIADGEGKAQGMSIERGLRIQDVIGRIIIMQEVGTAKEKEEGGNEGNGIRKRGPALGVIGCQCMNRQ